MIQIFTYAAIVFTFIQTCGCKTSDAKEDTEKSRVQKPTSANEVSKLEQALIDAGLVDIQTIEPGIKVELKYSTTDNFMKMDMYGDFTKAYLQPDVAEKLAKAYKLLKEKRPDYTLLVYDCVRPRSIQQMMWDSLKLPLEEKTKFISNPQNGSLHNYGAAVDLTICNKKGKALDMGTIYDYIGELARPELENRFLAEGKLTQQQVDDRKLLRAVMLDAGFKMIENEWWHFNSCSREEAKVKYKIIE
ncbi:MAG: M15 family metallopeptidase [Fimbriimonadaceae bacterium]|nr:M15 family metallopeptidase [Chitinophagales bacterium]